VPKQLGFGFFDEAQATLDASARPPHDATSRRVEPRSSRASDTPLSKTSQTPRSSLASDPPRSESLETARSPRAPASATESTEAPRASRVLEPASDAKHASRTGAIAALLRETPEAPPLHLAQKLALAFGRPVRLTITDNRRSMVSARRGEAWLEVRLHRMFLGADDALISAIARYVAKRDRAAGDVIDAFIAERAHQITKPRQRRTVIRTRGAHHDLRRIYDALLPLFVESFDDVRITWGRLTRLKRGQRGLQLGTYTPSEQLVRIHPVLDQAWVPEYVVATVVHHEMLHHALPAVEANGKTFFHTPEFRRRERAYVDHDRTAAWERANLGTLLRTMPR
jgi:hypothetical protein